MDGILEQILSELKSIRQILSEDKGSKLVYNENPEAQVNKCIVKTIENESTEVPIIKCTEKTVEADELMNTKEQRLKTLFRRGEV